MAKTKLQIEEKYSGDFPLEKILMQLLTQDTATSNDNAPIIIRP